MANAQHDEGRDASPKQVVVCGAGVIGACTAYFLAKKGVKVTVVEKCRVACAASGKAGGFLAIDWCQGDVGRLARASFLLHEQLAEEFGDRYEYRKVETLSLSVNEQVAVRSSKKSRGVPAWVDGAVSNVREIGSTTTTAQVHPRKFTETLIDEARRKHGLQLRIGEVGDVVTAPEAGTGGSSKRRVEGVMVDGVKIAADAVVLAMGPWSNDNKLLRGLVNIHGSKASSIVLKPKNPERISEHMLFLRFVSKEGKVSEPEIYPRSSGEVYVCTGTNERDVPSNPDDIKPTEGSAERLRRIAASVSSELGGADVAVEQACFLPISEDGDPVIGPVPGVEGAYVATGHSCWGILNAPITGMALSELIVEGKSKLVDLSPFFSERFLSLTR